jgi:hypothetical protein
LILSAKAIPGKVRPELRQDKELERFSVSVKKGKRSRFETLYHR